MRGRTSAAVMPPVSNRLLRQDPLMPTSALEEKERKKAVARSTTARWLHPPSETAGDRLLHADGWRGGRGGRGFLGEEAVATTGGCKGGACRESKCGRLEGRKVLGNSVGRSTKVMGRWCWIERQRMMRGLKRG